MKQSLATIASLLLIAGAITLTFLAWDELWSVTGEPWIYGLSIIGTMLIVGCIGLIASLRMQNPRSSQ